MNLISLVTLVIIETKIKYLKAEIKEQGYLSDGGWSTRVVAVVVLGADAVHRQNCPQR